MNEITYYKEERPWGSFEQFAKNEPVTVKIITVKAGEAFSLQTHEKREEFWRALSGEGKITFGETIEDIQVGKDYHIKTGMKHRIEAGASDVVILEVARGVFDEDDIIRLDDKYGR
ncbi:MAG: phosphomannose isomerase type II C-terminal cupin domain [Patescibacteria group bacterium]